MSETSETGTWDICRGCNRPLPHALGTEARECLQIMDALVADQQTQLEILRGLRHKLANEIQALWKQAEK